MIHPKSDGTAVVLFSPAMQLPARSVGGGGGGNHSPLPASRGELPRFDEKQFVPPAAEPPKTPDPRLVMEPTLVGPPLANLPRLNTLNLGDPNGVEGPPSSGPGKNGGIGGGDKGGVGDNKGPGFGDKNGGGCCGDTPYAVGGDVKAPTVLYRVEPQYSEEARKARYEGTVVLQAIVRRDGTVDIVRLVRSLGYGLDQNAMEALKQWRFRPATKDGIAVDSTVDVEVRFNLR
jgi:TonB family protein